MTAAASASEPRPKTTRVMLVDDSPVVRQGLRALLELMPGMQVVGEAADGAQAVTLASSLEPDAVLLDLHMPVMDGLTAARRLRSLLPGCRLVALSVHSSENDRRRAREAGVDAHIVKGSPVEELAAALAPDQGRGKERS